MPIPVPGSPRTAVQAGSPSRPAALVPALTGPHSQSSREQDVSPGGRGQGPWCESDRGLTLSKWRWTPQADGGNDDGSRCDAHCCRRCRRCISRALRPGVRGTDRHTPSRRRRQPDACAHHAEKAASAGNARRHLGRCRCRSCNRPSSQRPRPDYAPNTGGANGDSDVAVALADEDLVLCTVRRGCLMV